MRNVRVRRRRFLELHRITVGDFIILAASILTVASLFMTWFKTTVPGAHDQWAFTYSEVASVVVIVFFLATLFLIIYPAIPSDAGVPRLPFSTPLVFLSLGTIMLLLFTYELGKYDCIECQGVGVGRGFGVWVALIAAVFYLVGAIIKWGSRPTRPAER